MTEKHLEREQTKATRRTFVKRAAGVAGALAMAPGLLREAAAAETHGAKPPNLIFILGEGVRPDETSAAGNKLLKTPNLDRLQREGGMFPNAFCTNALCLPARASMLTGMYSHTTGAVDNQHSKVPADVPLLSDLLRGAGYEVAFFGKSHVEGALLDREWDYYFGFKGSASYFHPVIVEGAHGKYAAPKKYDEYADDLLTRKAVEWMDGRGEKPFCVFLWFYAPHAPFFRPLRAVTRFDGDFIPKPPSFDEYLNDYKGKPAAVKSALNKIGEQFVQGDAVRSLEELVKDHYVGVEDNDRNIGEMFGALEKSGKLADTAMVWSSDHGFFLGEHRFYDKRLMYEPSIRIPMVVRYPRRVKAGTTSREMVLNVDVMPTLLDLAGIKPAASVQGTTFMPLLEGKRVSWRKDWLYEYYDFPGSLEVRPCRGVRNERYKYIHYFLDPQEYEFYDLQTDPHEMHNLYGDPAYKDLIARHATRLEELRRETGDTYVYRPTVKREE